MATIEPRLMHLLNDTQSPDLPSIQLLNHATSTNNSLSLPPIEPDTRGQRGERAAPQKIPPFCSIADDLPLRQAGRVDGSYQTEAATTSSTTALPVHQLLDDNDSLPLRTLVASYPAELSEDATTKKRQRALTVHQDFVQLPQPLKKRKSTQQVVPPIINGLHEPPQDAAVFPPIRFEDEDLSNLNSLKDFTVFVEDVERPTPSAEPEKQDKPDKTSRGRAKRRIGKPRRKWSEEETNHLLLGVNKHGVGKWTSILEDPEYNFNERTAGDLKDRFRTCCPAELREQLTHRDSGSERPRPGLKPKPKKSLPLENILIDDDDDIREKRKGPSSIASINHDSDSAGPKNRKSRAHRKNIEDLEELGIRAPFKKSERRERRPFTEEDDREILDGLHEYGPAWTKIQRDTRFHLTSRQPTDLRDRVRNKYPDIYASIEKGSFQSIQLGRGTTKILEPSVNTSIANSLANTFEPHLDRTNSKESMSRCTLPSSGLMESYESLPGISSFEMGDGSSSTFMTSGEEMSISRLMIGDPQSTSDYGTAGAFDERSATGVHGQGTAERRSTKPGQQFGEMPRSPGRSSFKPLNSHNNYW